MPGYIMAYDCKCVNLELCEISNSHICANIFDSTVPIVVDKLIGSKGLRMHRSIDDHYPYQLQ